MNYLIDLNKMIKSIESNSNINSLEFIKYFKEKKAKKEAEEKARREEAEKKRMEEYQARVNESLKSVIEGINKLPKRKCCKLNLPTSTLIIGDSDDLIDNKGYDIVELKNSKEIELIQIENDNEDEDAYAFGWYLKLHEGKPVKAERTKNEFVEGKGNPSAVAILDKCDLEVWQKSGKMQSMGEDLGLALYNFMPDKMPNGFYVDKDKGMKSNCIFVWLFPGQSNGYDLLDIYDNSGKRIGLFIDTH